MEDVVYRGLNYLENTMSGEAFDLGITPDSTVEFDIKYSILDVFGLYVALIGARQSSNFTGLLYFPVFSSSSKLGFQLNSGVNANFTHKLNTEYRALMQNKYFSLYEQDTLKAKYNLTSYYTAQSYNFNMYLFAGNSHNSTTGEDEITDPALLRIYYCKVYKNGILVRDLIPVVRIEDNVCSLYDRISKQFMTPISGNTQYFTGELNHEYYDANGDKISTIVEKLNYTLETKELLRDKLNEKGCNISESDTFRSYVNAVDNIKYNTTILSSIVLSSAGYADNDSLKKMIVKLPESLDFLDCDNATNTFNNCYNLEKIPQLLNTSQIKLLSYFFANCFKIKTIPEFDTSNVTKMNRMFYKCESLESIPLLNMSNVTDTSFMFIDCINLTNVPEFDLSNVVTGDAMFDGCESLVEVPKLNFTNATSLYQLFNGCTNLTNIPELNISNVQNVNYLLCDCTSLVEVPILDLSSANKGLSTMFARSTNIEVLGGLKNLGKAYTQQEDNYATYALTLSSCKKLTYDSLMNVINDLYDLNLTYDVENGGTLYTQKLVIGSDNLAKLSDEDIAIATAKGWTVS